MLALGACFVVFGAFLRHRSGPRMYAAKRSVADRTEKNPSVQKRKTTELNKPPLSQAAKPNNEKTAPAVLSTFLAVQETLTDPVASNEGP
jgi:hypothetical protein